MAAPMKDAEWLSWVARLMESSAAQENLPRKAPEGYCCLLDEQPTHLVPERLLRQLPGNQFEGELCFNPLCYLADSETRPEDLRAAELALSDAGEIGATTAWIEDAATEAWTPFWLSPALHGLVREIQDRPARIQELSLRTRKLLCQAGILLQTSGFDARGQAWARIAEAARAKFSESGYAPISGLLHPFHVGALRKYFRRKVRKGAVLLGDDQSARRYIAHNDPAARFFHLQLTKAVSVLAGTPVKPSYVYMASYQSGARLEKHTDRAQCEISITLCLDYSPEPAGATPWPLHLDAPKATVTVYQAPGDGLLYRGRELPHYRGTLREGNTSTSIFFHHVPVDFDGPLE
jgi:hypothetical protein